MLQISTYLNIFFDICADISTIFTHAKFTVLHKGEEAVAEQTPTKETRDQDTHVANRGR